MPKQWYTIGWARADANGVIPTIIPPNAGSKPNASEYVTFVGIAMVNAATVNTEYQSTTQKEVV